MEQALHSSDYSFTQLAEKFEKDINYIIKTKVFNYNSSDVCFERDDVKQLCLEALWNATKIYDPSKGMKFRSFAIFHIHSRLGNFRNKVTRKNSYGTVSMSDLNDGWGITGREESCQDQSSNSTVSPQYKSSVSELAAYEDVMNEILDAKKVLERLTGHRKLLFSEYYIKGKKIKEICEENPELKYHQVRRHMKYLDAIYKTLIKGETPCLQN